MRWYINAGNHVFALDRATELQADPLFDLSPRGEYQPGMGMLRAGSPALGRGQQPLLSIPASFDDDRRPAGRAWNIGALQQAQ